MLGNSGSVVTSTLACQSNGHMFNLALGWVIKRDLSRSLIINDKSKNLHTHFMFYLKDISPQIPNNG